VRLEVQPAGGVRWVGSLRGSCSPKTNAEGERLMPVSDESVSCGDQSLKVPTCRKACVKICDVNLVCSLTSPAQYPRWESLPTPTLPIVNNPEGHEWSRGASARSSPVKTAAKHSSVRRLGIDPRLVAATHTSVSGRKGIEQDDVRKVLTKRIAPRQDIL